MNKANKTLGQVIDYHEDLSADKKYRFTLAEDVLVETGILNYAFESDYLKLDKQGNLVMKNRYAWDGATGAKDTRAFIFPSALHDALYQLIRLNVLPTRYRAYADRLLRLAAIAQNMSGVKAWLAYFVVRFAGWYFTGNAKAWIDKHWVMIKTYF